MTTIAELEERVLAVEEQLNELDEFTLKTWVEDISDMDLDYQMGVMVIGYGNGCTNKPTGAGNGWLINIPHATDHLKERYNKQFWIERIQNKIWVRTMENGVWGTWELV